MSVLPVKSIDTIFSALLASSALRTIFSIWVDESLGNEGNLVITFLLLASYFLYKYVADYVL